LWMRKRTAHILLERMTRSIDIHIGSKGATKKWIAKQGCSKDKKPDRAELLLRSVLRKL